MNPPAFEDDDPITPAEEALRELHAKLDVAEDANVEVLGELDAMRAELEAAREELRDALARAARIYSRYIELVPDPMHLPSKPKDRPRFAGEDHDDYALRGQ